MLKKITIISIIAILLIGGFLLFSYFSSSTPFFEDREGEDRGFFPFGEGESNDEGGGRDQGYDFGDEDNAAPIFRKVSENPVSGSAILSKNGKIFIRYNERETGHIFETPATSTRIDRISNTTMPKINKVIWAESGNAFLARYLGEDDETIKTFYAKINPQKEGENTEEQVEENGEEEEKEKEILETKFLKENIRSISINKEGSEVFFIKKEGDSSNAYTVDTESEKTNFLFSSKLNGFNTLWQGDDLYLLSAPSYVTDGFLFSIYESGGYKKEISNKKGLVALPSPDGNYILFTESEDRSFKTFIKNKDGKVSKTSINTLPEKCAWGKKSTHIVYCGAPRTIKSGEYPDDWYKGKTSFVDDIWKINAKKNISEKIYTINTEQYGELNIENVKISEEDKYIIFEDRNTLTLWSLRIGE